MDNIKASVNTRTPHFPEAQEIKIREQSTKRKTGKKKAAKRYSIKSENHSRKEQKIHNYEKISILERAIPKSVIICKISESNRNTKNHQLLLESSMESLRKSINELYNFLDSKNLKKPEEFYTSRSGSKESTEINPTSRSKSAIELLTKPESHQFDSNYDKNILYSIDIQKKLSNSDMNEMFKMFHVINNEADIVFKHFLNSKNFKIKPSESYRDLRTDSSVKSMRESESFIEGHFKEINDINTIYLNIIINCINKNSIYKGRLYNSNTMTDLVPENTERELTKLIKTTSLVAKFLHISYSLPMCIHSNHPFRWAIDRSKQLQQSLITLMMLINERASLLIGLSPDKIISAMSSIFGEFSESERFAVVFMGDIHLSKFIHWTDYLKSFSGQYEVLREKTTYDDGSTQKKTALEAIEKTINTYSAISFAYILNDNPAKAYYTIHSLKEFLTYIFHNNNSLKNDSEFRQACRLWGFSPVCQFLIMKLDTHCKNSQKALEDNQLEAVYGATALSIESKSITDKTLNDESILQYTKLTNELSSLIDIFKIRNENLYNENICTLIDHIIEDIQRPELSYFYESMRSLSHAERLIKKITSIRNAIHNTKEENYLKLSKSADDNYSELIKKIEEERNTTKQKNKNKNKKEKKKKPSTNNEKRKQHPEESLAATSSTTQTEGEDTHPELKNILSAIDLRTIDSSSIDRLKELLENIKKAKEPNIIHIASVEFSLVDLLIHDINNDCNKSKSTEEINIILNDYYAKLKEYSEISKDENDEFFSAIRALITLSSIFSEKFDHVLSAYQNYLEFYSKNYSRLTRELQDISSIKDGFSKINKSFKDVFELIPYSINIYKFRYIYLCKMKGTESISPSKSGKSWQGEIKNLEDKAKKLEEITLSNNYLMIGNSTKISTSSEQPTSKSDIEDDSFSEEIRKNLRNTGLILPESLSESLSEFWKLCKTNGTNEIKIKIKELEQKTPLISTKWGIESLFENYISNIIYDKTHSIEKEFPRDEWIERHQNRQLFTQTMQQASETLKTSIAEKTNADSLFDWDMLILSDALSLPLRCLVDRHSLKHYYPGFSHNQSDLLDFSYKQEDDARLGVHFDFFDGKFRATPILRDTLIFLSE